MDEVLKKFLEQGQKVQDSMPIYHFPAPSEVSGNDGILEIYFTKWAYFKGLLNAIDVKLDACFRKGKSIKAQLETARKVLGSEMTFSQFTEPGWKFAKTYYWVGWKYSYLKDFSEAYPGYERFELVPNSESNYAMIAKILDRRFIEWTGQPPSVVTCTVAAEPNDHEAGQDAEALDKESWLAKMSAALAGRRDEAAALRFHDLVYQAPADLDGDIAEMLMKSYLSLFESSVMAACQSMLSGVPFDVYYDAYFKWLPQLLDRNSDVAVNLLDFPGHELSRREIKKILHRLEAVDESGDLRKRLIRQIKHWNLVGDEPWQSFCD